MFSVKDKDSISLSEATIVLSNRQTGDNLTYSDTFWTVTENDTAKTLTLTSKSSEFGKAISIFEQAIRSVKFINSEDNPNTNETRKISLTVKDAATSATSGSDSANKLSETVDFDLIVLGTNDIPTFSTSQNTLSYTEGTGASPLLSNATITDGDVTNLNNLIPDQAIVKFVNGYRSNEDQISIPTSYSAPMDLMRLLAQTVILQLKMVVVNLF